MCFDLKCQELESKLRLGHPPAPDSMLLTILSTYFFVKANYFIIFKGYEDDKPEDEAWKKHLLENGPVILTLHANVTVAVGGTAQLPCRIKNLGEYTVSLFVIFTLSDLK